MRYYLCDGEVRRDNHQPKYKIECDVLVIGTNENGCVTAVNAARAGYRVISADKCKMPMQDGRARLSSKCGVYGEMRGNADAIIGDVDLCLKNCKNNAAQMLKIRELFKQNGVSFLADSVLHSLYMNGKTPEGASFITADGIFEIKCGNIFDFSGTAARILGKCDDGVASEDKFARSEKLIKTGLS